MRLDLNLGDAIAISRPNPWLAFIKPKTPEATYDLMRRSHPFWNDRKTQKTIFRGHANSNWLLKPSAWRTSDLPKKFVQKFYRAGHIRHYNERAIDHDRASKMPYRDHDVNSIATAAIQFGSEMHAVMEFWNACNAVALSTPPMEITIRNTKHVPPDLQKLKYMWDSETSLKEWMPTEIFALAQHHGVPTRLLDFTTNPKKALLFAIEAHVKGHSNSEMLAVWALGEMSSYNVALDHYLPSGFPVARLEAVTFSRASNSYMHHQDGVFVFAKNCDHWAIMRGAYPSLEDVFDLFLGTEGLEKDRLGASGHFATSIRILGGKNDVGTLPLYGTDIDLPLACKIIFPKSFAGDLFGFLEADELTPLHLMPTYDNATRYLAMKRELG